MLKPIGNTVADHLAARGHHVYPIGCGAFVCRCGHAWQYTRPAINGRARSLDDYRD